jgi:arylsulfatase A-like enzyme/predicted negative regulator of RcsB-dependent stress response
MRAESLLVTALAAALAGACARSPDEIRVPSGTPIVLISIDTLRSDHLPAYGYTGVATPAIDALRRQSILFERAYANVPLTLPSHASILTGLLPYEHGVRDNMGYKLDAGKVPYLPTLLKSRGYATGAAVSSYVLRGATGLERDFDFYEDGVEFRSRVGIGGIQRAGAETLDLALGWVRSVAGQPFFLFVHFYEPHTPYTPPAPWAERYPASPYDGEIAASDELVGKLVAELERLGVYDRALVVLLSDHGEGLGDHGEDEHGVLLYRESLQVPLLVKLPEGELGNRTAREPAQLADVFTTIAALAGVEPQRTSGLSLLRLLDRRPPERWIYSETLYPRFHFGWSDLASLIDRRWHYIEGPAPELYDLAAAPQERDDLRERERRAAAELRGALARIERSVEPPAAEDEETRRQLAALGYLGTAAAAPAGPLPDPKTQVHVLRDLKEAYAAFNRRDFAAAVAGFRRVVDANPRALDAWEQLGISLQEVGEAEPALAAFQQAMRLTGGGVGPALSTAGALLELERFDEAEAHARLALEEEPSAAHGVLARVALARRDFALAEREARAALEAATDSRLGARVLLAEVLHRADRDEEALRLLEEAAREYTARQTADPELVRGLFYLHGEILADRGDAAGAERSFREEIRRFPHDSRGYTHLAVLLALDGRGAEVGPLLRQMVEARPVAASYAAAVETLRVLEDERSAAALLRHARSRFPGDRLLEKLERGG